MQIAWCYTHPMKLKYKSCYFKTLMLHCPNKSEYQFCCYHNGNYYSSGMNAASISNHESEKQHCTGLRSTCDHPQQPDQLQSWDRGHGDHSSPKQFKKSIFSQPEVLPTISFLKEVNCIKSFLLFLVFS